MARSKRIKTDAIQAPTTQAEAEEMLKNIGELDRDVSRIEAAMNDELIGIKSKHEQQAQPLNEKINQLFHAVHIWAEANKDTLLKSKAKTAKLATGEISWRTTPPRVKITGKPAVIERLKNLGLKQFLRTVEDVNKEAMLADKGKASSVDGISISQREEFVAKPFESEIERTEPIKKTS